MSRGPDHVVLVHMHCYLPAYLSWVTAPAACCWNVAGSCLCQLLHRQVLYRQPQGARKPADSSVVSLHHPPLYGTCHASLFAQFCENNLKLLQVEQQRGGETVKVR